MSMPTRRPVLHEEDRNRGSNRRPEPAPRDVDWIWCLAGAAAGSLAVLLLGSLVHNQYVPGWPLVLGSFIPELST